MPGDMFAQVAVYTFCGVLVLAAIAAGIAFVQFVAFDR